VHADVNAHGPVVQGAPHEPSTWGTNRPWERRTVHLGHRQAVPAVR